MGGSKLPGLQVNSPKGTGKKIEERDLVEKTGGIQGEKRIVTDPGESDTTEQGSLKRRRMTRKRWKTRMTFILTCSIYPLVEGRLLWNSSLLTQNSESEETEIEFVMRRDGRRKRRIPQ